ncbi:putative RNA methyltransferase At5g10620 isoform X1 [Solanum tuberosum]|nr:PREDICTED: putative RNA methyltransferase At5g10620 isoform X1 [Solanum tuberosum]
MAVSPVAGLNSKLSLPSGKQQHSKFTGQSVRAIPIRILTVGKNRSQGVQLIVDEYMKKLRNYCSVDDVRIKSNPKNARDVVAQIEHEDIAVMGLIKPDEWVVMLDERGHDVGSEQMASLIGDAGNKGASSLLFCIGGPYGHGRQLRERANISVKLSSLVLNHEIALVVLIEQLYRSETGTNYYSFEVLVPLTPPLVPHLC